jgi:adenylosuccinate synthase
MRRDEPFRIVVLSGSVGSGKSTIAALLALRYGAVHVRTQSLMRDVAAKEGVRLEAERRALQEFGDSLDQRTGGGWVADGVAELIANGQIDSKLVVVDAARIVGQIDRLRTAFPNVTHIHLEAPREELSRRYEARKTESLLSELEDYEQVQENETEAAVPALARDADVSIDTKRNTRQDVLTRTAAALRLMAPRSERLVDVIVGGQYGSEGKGNVAFHIANDYDVLMRVGGPNAGHQVPTDPVFIHRLLPSGTLANPQATLLIGPGATLDISVLQAEISACEVEVGRLFIDPQAMVIEQSDIDAERSMKASIGSTGKGGGSAAARRIMGRLGTGTGGVRLARDVEELKPYVAPTGELLERAFEKGQRVLLEGTQGTALSLFHGDYPHVTSRDTTVSGCLAEAGIGIHRVRRSIVVVRVYPIRVGSPEQGFSGAMSQELSWDEVAERAGLDPQQLQSLERGSVSGTERRVAEFDWVLLKRASELNGATDIALTFADYIDSSNSHARRYDQLTEPTINFVEEIERVAGAPVSLIATGFDRRSLIDRREW